MAALAFGLRRLSDWSEKQVWRRSNETVAARDVDIVPEIE